MSAAMKSRADLMLCLLFAGEDQSRPLGANAPIAGITRLEKLLFLLKKEGGLLSDVPDTKDFHFVPFRMGPWTQEVYDEVDFLESLGLLKKARGSQASPVDSAHDEELFGDVMLTKYEKGEVQAGEQSESFELTSRGKAKARQIWKQLTETEKKTIMSIKSKFNTVSLKQFLRYVYKKHPEYATESEIKEYLGLDKE